MVHTFAGAAPFVACRCALQRCGLDESRCRELDIFENRESLLLLHVSRCQNLGRLAVRSRAAEGAVPLGKAILEVTNLQVSGFPQAPTMQRSLRLQ
eukprot:2171134-Amphidinium_carterae.1